MFYSFDLAIPASTAQSDPAELEVDLTWGIVSRVMVEFPPGCAGLAGVRILERRHQLWPTNLDSWLYSDGRCIEWQEYHELYHHPVVFTLLGYNLDDTFPHTPVVRFEILHPAAMLSRMGGAPAYPQVRRLTWEEM